MHEIQFIKNSTIELIDWLCVINNTTSPNELYNYSKFNHNICIWFEMIYVIWREKEKENRENKRNKEKQKSFVAIYTSGLLMATLDQKYE